MKKLIQRLLFGEVQGEPIGSPNPRTISTVSANLYEVQPYITPTHQEQVRANRKRQAFSMAGILRDADKQYLARLDDSFAAKVYRSHCLPPEFNTQGQYKIGVDVANGKDETVKATFQVRTSIDGETEFYRSKLKPRK